MNRGMDPVRYARLSGMERLFMDLVLTRAQQLHADEMRAMAEAVGALVGNRVGEIMAKAFS